MTFDLLTLGRTLKQVQYRHHRALDTRLNEIGISLTQWDALRAIGSQPDSSAHALAQATFQTDQAFSTLAGRLLQRGWIQRIAGPGRAIRHRLTASGRTILSKGHAVASETLAESFVSLSHAERGQLQGLLERILESGS